ncbi:major facilitator superfamily MFS-1 [Leucogyrophana mollusca]|uniref:Major facilitator superfamily MFS-1 n=1 Tax=Leucogyrophana mollusca TaxID=85980 RepID=A0ACB8B3B3_9AGAM|nr:major facilitator superfamily MFS-1 [Leucogyrophana mollusca]
MSNNPKPSNLSLPPRRSFGIPASGIDEQAGESGRERRSSRRVSANHSQHRPSFASRWTINGDEESGVKSPGTERPPIPNALQTGEAYSTPLPALSMIVLSITMLGEFLSANVAMPFLLFMVKGFGEFQDEADIAFYTGILVAAFFLTQFFTSLLWATVAERHGQRPVLTISLLGSAVTVLIFGTSTTLRQAIAIRLLQGIFAGAVGVARGCVASVTDTSNEGRAYAILGFCWGLGGVAGAIIGGSFETPAEKWPDVFAHVPLLVQYPYLLPCAVAASITFTGSILSCFLGRDGGPREGAVRLPYEKPNNQHPTIPEEDLVTPSSLVEEPPLSFAGTLKRKVSRRLSGYFASRVPTTHALDIPSTSRGQAVPLSPRTDRRVFSRTSRANGSAYGYSGSYRNRLSSSATMGTRRDSMASSMRRSNVDGPQSFVEGGDLNFAQRLLMANENAVTNIADLWVAAAMNVDHEDPFELDAEMDSDIESIMSEQREEPEDDDRPDSIMSTPTRRGRTAPRNLTSAPSPPTVGERSSVVTFAPSFGSPRRPASGLLHAPATDVLGSPSRPLLDGTPTSRRVSVTSPPTIFAHPGVRTPSAVLDAQTRAEELSGDALAPILERRRLSTVATASGDESIPEKPPSLTSQLPILVIVQYGLLALHSTTHDQVFLSYLVTDYESGGLNLNPGHFSQLIALMCLAQIVYQFYLYPNIGPPRGRFSHLAMFRLGSLLFIPAYLTVILYRVFASSSDDGNFVLMSALAISTAVRYCGNTFAYTAVSILLNYMTPPHAVGFANGVAQSIVSLARCFGPVLGGYLWAISTQDNPSGYPLGFLACAGACALAVAHSFFIR